METQQQTDVGDFNFLVEDAKRLQRRAAAATYLEAKVEFKENTYPLLIATIETLGAAIAELQAAVSDQDSFVLPELAASVKGTLEIGKVLALAVKEIQAGPLDELALKRLHDAAEGYLSVCDATIAAVEEATAEEVDDESDEEDVEAAAGNDGEVA